MTQEEFIRDRIKAMMFKAETHRRDARIAEARAETLEKEALEINNIYSLHFGKEKQNEK